MPDRVNSRSFDVASHRRAELKALFPAAFTETRNERGELRESIDFEKLKAELGTFSDVFENRRERYGMDWPGKKDCLKVIQQPSHATLKPCREESVEFDSTENLFIEGDNLEVLKLLQKSYYGKVKMIYIDPPYNTGNEFIYPDNYGESLDTYLAYAGLSDSEGKRFATNTLNEGRFHTRWLNMMYPRLYLARNLLREDGAIFISIDENEVSNLRKVCGEIFGEENFVGAVARVAKKTSNKGTHFAPSKDYVVVYCRNIQFLPTFMDEVDPTYSERFDGIDERGQFAVVGLYQAALDSRPNQRYWIQCPDGSFVIPPGTSIPTTVEDGAWVTPDSDADRVWRWSYSSYKEKKDLLVFKKTKKSPLITPDGSPASWNVYTKYYLKDRLADGIRPRDFLASFTNEQGTRDLASLRIANSFDFAKPVGLITRLLTWMVDRDAIVLDFFAGSATTAHAVLHLNAQDGGNRKFICVQLPEPCNEASEAFKVGFNSIADIGKERIRRVIKKLNDEKQAKPDLERSTGQDRGFRVLKLDRSNFRQWPDLEPDSPSEKIIEQLELHIDHVDTKASREDLLFEVLIKAGLSPASKIETVELAGLPVFSVDAGRVLICLAETVTQELVDAVAKAEPDQFLCLDHAFHGNDQLRANASQTFEARQNSNPNARPIAFRTI